MTKNRKKIILIAVIIVLVVIDIILGIYLLNRKGADSDTVDEHAQILQILSAEEAEEETISYADNWTVLRPSTDNILLDEETGTIYYDNILMVYLLNDPSSDILEGMAQLVGGEIAGYAQKAQLLQIRVPSTDLEALNTLAGNLMNSEYSEYVMYATFDFPLSLSDQDANPWSEDGKVIEDKNSETAGGNDWWAEAIGAYTAWDKYAQYTNDIVGVAVIDNGIDTGHEELSGRVTTLNSNNLERNLASVSHGTGVAALIAAQDNEVGLRGTAGNAAVIVGIDWRQGEDNNLLANFEFCSLLEEAIIGGAKVVNMSFGYSYPTMYEYYLDEKDNNLSAEWAATMQNMKEKLFKTKGSPYYKCLWSIAKQAQQSALTCMISIDHLYALGETDYLLVCSAGNGNGVDAASNHALDTVRWNGFFASITEDLFNFSHGINKIFGLTKGMTYDFVRDRIMVVSAVEQSGENSYKPVDNWNFGSAIDICAPGKKIFTAKADGGYTDSAQGTSFAAPMVAGAAAFIWSMDETMEPGEVKRYLTENTDTVIQQELPGDYVNWVRELLGSFEGDWNDYNIFTINVPSEGYYSYPMLNMGKAAEAVYTERLGGTPKQNADTAVNTGSSEYSAFREYLRNTLVPQYGVMPTDLLDSSNLPEYTGWDASELKGMLSATIRDYDGDGYDEMLITMFDTDSNGDTDLILQMYEYAANTDTVYLGTETRLDTANGYSGSSIIGFRQNGIFSYEHNGSTYIAVDSSLIANESVSSLAVFTYIGVNSEYTQPGAQTPDFGTGTPTQFAYYGGAGYQQQGSGLWIVFEGLPSWEGRRTVEPENPLFCASWSSEWTELCRYDQDSMGGAVISTEQSREFMNTYRGRVQELGLLTDDVRLADVPSALTQDKYVSEHTCTPQIYTPAEGEIEWIAGIYTYSKNYPSEPHELLREDNQHTLDEFR